MALSKLVDTNLQGMSTKVDEKLNKQSQITSCWKLCRMHVLF